MLMSFRSVRGLLGLCVVIGLLGMGGPTWAQDTPDTGGGALIVVCGEAPELEVSLQPVEAKAALPAPSTISVPGSVDHLSEPINASAAVPEPGTVVLMGVGLLLLIGVKKHYRP